MANAFLKFFKEPSPGNLIRDKQEVDRKYRHFQWRLFYSLYIGYVVSYIGRKNLSFAAPWIAEHFDLSKTEFSLFFTTFYVTYGIGKFVNGVLADKSNVRTFFSTALVLAAMSLFCFALSASFSFLSIAVIMGILNFWWAANSWFQSMTFPPIAKTMTYWFPKKTRGVKWSLISTSHQVGTFLAIPIASVGVDLIGWQSAFYIPGAITLLTGLWLFNRLRDKPATLGLPEVETYNNLTEEEKIDYLDNLSNDDIEKIKVENDTDEKEEVAKPKMSHWEIFKKYILFNPIVWILAISYMFVYVVRTATEDWLTFFFKEARGNTKLQISAKLSSLTLVGALGTISSGFLSDKFFKGKRNPINILFLFGLLGSLLVFLFTTPKYEVLDFVSVPLIGFFTAGLQNLVGLYIVEICAKDVSSAVNGFAGSFSYLGAFLAGQGTGYIADKFTWNGAVIYWVLATVIAILLYLIAIPMKKKS